MSLQYDEYLKKHIANVYDGYLWFMGNVGADKIDAILPEVNWMDMMVQLKFHDESKTRPDEYSAYDAYFYGGEVSGDELKKIQEAFDYAWLSHIHRNPHHWQHWVLIEDDAGGIGKALDIPDKYLFEMICDWWSFSWRKGDLYEIFNWWDEHTDKVILSPKSREKVEKMLELIRETLDKNAGSGGGSDSWGAEN